MKKYLVLGAVIAVLSLFSNASPVRAQSQTTSNCMVYGSNVHCTDSNGNSSNSYCWSAGNMVSCNTTNTPANTDNGYAAGYALGAGIGVAIQRHRQNKAMKMDAEWCLQNPTASWPSGTTCSQYLAMFSPSTLAKYTQELKKQGKLN